MPLTNQLVAEVEKRNPEALKKLEGFLKEFDEGGELHKFMDTAIYDHYKKFYDLYSTK